MDKLVNGPVFHLRTKLPAVIHEGIPQEHYGLLLPFLFVSDVVEELQDILIDVGCCHYFEVIKDGLHLAIPKLSTAVVEKLVRDIFEPTVLLDHAKPKLFYPGNWQA